MLDLQRTMQMQLDAQAARSRAQRNLGSMAQHSAAEVMPMGQLGLSVTVPAFVPGPGLPGIGMTFYSLTPHNGDHTQQMGSVSDQRTKLTQ